MLMSALSCNTGAAEKATDDFLHAPERTKDYTTEDLSMEEFVNWYSEGEHKLTKTKDVSEIRYQLSFLPAEAMAFLELRKTQGGYDFSRFQQVRQDYSEMSYFSFKIQAPENSGELLKYQLSSPAAYEERVKYLSFQMEKDIWLIQDKDTIPPGLYHFERVFEAAPYATAMFAFDNKLFRRDAEFTIVYHDQLFDKGFIKFNYKPKQLINLPNISAL
jgi:hypothetical protein